MQTQFPIEDYEEEIVETVRKNPVVVIAAETGAGKSTKVPMMLYTAGIDEDRMIAVTQPRRVAAMTLATWVAQSDGSELGDLVGYHIRGESRLSKETMIKYMIEGILLAELHSDPELRRYNVIVVDEAHERGVNQDLLLALLKKVMRKRKDLKLVIMSATIDEDRFSKNFDNCPVIKVPGRVFPVEVRYAPNESDLRRSVEVCADRVIEILNGREPGDILVFMPDENTIKETCKRIEEKMPDGVMVFPLYGTQSPDEQREALAERSERRVIVATNIAETSLTIDGVVHVVDSGFIKQVRYVSATMSALEIAEHSQAGCDQRKGRAGRTQAGICHRMFLRDQFDERDGFTKPEILRMSLDQVLLHLRCLRYSMDEILSLEFMDAPGEKRWREAEEILKMLGCIDETGDVSPVGQRIERLKVAPMLGRMLLESEKYGCVNEMATIVAGFISRPLFVRPKDKDKEADASHAKFKDRTSDALTTLAVWNKWNTIENEKRRATTSLESVEAFFIPINSWTRDNFLSFRALKEIERNRDQLLETLSREGIEITSNTNPVMIRKSVAAGLIYNLCIRCGEYNYRWQSASDVFIHPGSSMMSDNPPRMLVCTQVRESTKVFAMGCTEIDEKWIDELIPAHMRERVWEIRRDYAFPRQVIETTKWHGNVLSQKVMTEFPEEAIPQFATWLANDCIDAISYTPFHVNAQANRETIRGIKKALHSQMKLAFFEQLPLDVMDSIRLLVTAFIAERIAHCRTVDDLLNTAIHFEVGDVTPEALKETVEAYLATQSFVQSAELERIEEYHRASDAAIIEYRMRQEDERREREEKMQPLRTRIDELCARLDRVFKTGNADHTRILNQLEYLKDQARDVWSQPRDIQSKLLPIEIKIGQFEEAAKKGFSLSEMVWDEMLGRYPVCPLCSGTWEMNSTFLSCNVSHDFRRVISLNGGSERNAVLTECVTDAGDVAVVAAMSAHEVIIQFDVSRDSVWKKKSFKTVAFREKAIVLTPDLVSKRDAIVADLQDVRKMRAELAELDAKLASVEATVGKGKMKRLKFRIENGKAVSREDMTTYVAAYSEPYPADRETWFCRIGRTLPSVGYAIEVHPEVKVTIAASDVSELAGALVESYPGLVIPQFIQ